MSEISNKVRMYSSLDIDHFSWPQSWDGQYAKHYILPLIKNGTKKYIANVDSKIGIIAINDKVLPITKSDPKLSNCYVCSPFDQYITYAKEELQTLNSPILESALKLFFNGLGVLLKLTNFNRVVYVNNWLLSTNLYPDLSLNEIASINHLIQKKYPNHIIIYRSLNYYTTPKLIKNLQACGGAPILSRQIYITDPNDPTYRKKSDFKKDQRHLKKSPLVVNENINENDISHIKKHYDDLYISKYTYLNPQFTEEFFRNAIKHNLFCFKLVEAFQEDIHNSKISKAVLGYFHRNNVMTTPIFGFDTNAPVRDGLYRIISTLLVNDSEKNNLILNQSSGAAEFKSQRGAKPYIEYNYYFTKGVSPFQRFSWKILSTILNNLGVRILRKYKL